MIYEIKDRMESSSIPYANVQESYIISWDLLKADSPQVRLLFHYLQQMTPQGLYASITSHHPPIFLSDIALYLADGAFVHGVSPLAILLYYAPRHDILMLSIPCGPKYIQFPCYSGWHENLDGVFSSIRDLSKSPEHIHAWLRTVLPSRKAETSSSSWYRDSLFTNIGIPERFFQPVVAKHICPCNLEEL